MHDLSGTFTNGLHAKFKQNESSIYSVSVLMVLDTIKLQNMWFDLSDLIALYISLFSSLKCFSFSVIYPLKHLQVS